MKLQYLGDARDAFKWDLFHWIRTKSTSPFSHLVYIPMLTPDGESPNEGNIHHSRFRCKKFFRPFPESLREKPRSLDRICKLGAAEDPLHFLQFQTTIFACKRLIKSGNNRQNYWHDFNPEKYENSIVFFDPDNGFETTTQSGTKWIRHEELRLRLSKLPENSANVVYKHRPRRTWEDLFADLNTDLKHYAHIAVAAYERDIAFVAIANNKKIGDLICKAINAYANDHRDVRAKKII